MVESGAGSEELPDGVEGLLTEGLRILATGSEGRGVLGGRGRTVVAVVAMAAGGTVAAVARGDSIALNM